MVKFRFATFNVENLFDRPKVFLEKNFADGDQALADISILQKLIRKSVYSAADKQKVVAMYAKVKAYVEIVESHGKLMNKEKSKVTAKGRAVWFGFLKLKRRKFNDLTVRNTAKVIKEVNPDIACLVEVEDRLVLDRFCAERLRWTRRRQRQSYAHNMLIDGNDRRGIDVGLISRHPIETVHSHIDDVRNGSPIFSRDCPEMEVRLPDGRSLWVILNHLKSKGYGDRSASNARRKNQAQAITKILKRYNLRTDLVIVAGDLNDTPTSAPLKPLMTVKHLHDVLDIVPASNRWTYHFRSNEQLDYVLVSNPLKDALKNAGVFRRGIYDVKKHSTKGETRLPSITSGANSASDHGCVWADFEL